MENISFGYMEIGVCGNCRKPNHLFAISEEYMASRCLTCWGSYIFFSNRELTLPTAETYPILNSDIPICKSCYRVELDNHDDWSLTMAYLGDGVTKIPVHKKCVENTVCTNCSVEYAGTNYRDFSNRSNFEHQYHEFSMFRRIEGDDYCGNCATTYVEENGGESDFFCCESCDYEVNISSSGWYNGTRYCNDCIENYVYTCDNCNEEQWDGNDHYCEEDDDNDESLIHSYSYRPSPFFFGTGKYYFGFELEVEARRNNRYEGAQMVQNSLGGHAYLKDDGSISDGFEIVTHPHTLEKYHTEFNWDILDKLKNDGYRSWNTSTCGLHVHVSRTAFGDGDPWDYRAKNSTRSQLLLKRQSHELRFMKLIYDNQRQVERIAGRSGNQYATFQDKGNLVQKIKYGRQESGRYSAINTENDDTLEVRVFKGSLRKERVLSAIEFVHASVEYTRDIKVTSKNHALSWLKFTGYVSANAEMYPNLVTIMSESFAGDTNPDESN